MILLRIAVLRINYNLTQTTKFRANIRFYTTCINIDDIELTLISTLPGQKVSHIYKNFYNSIFLSYVVVLIFPVAYCPRFV